MADRGRPTDETSLRTAAERSLAGRTAARSRPEEGLSATQVLHELEVHQIELEMQNEELRHAQLALDAARARYFELYELAPVGYLTLGPEGSIREANLRAAALLGQPRAALAGASLSAFVMPDDLALYARHWRQLADEAGEQTCELRLTRPEGGGPATWVRLESNVEQERQGDRQLAWTAGAEEGGQRLIRTAISNVTVHKRLEDDLRRMNRDLDQMVEERTRTIVEQNELLATKNTALQEMLGQLQTAREELQANVAHTAETLLFPAIARIKSRLTHADVRLVELLEENVKLLTTRYARRLSSDEYGLSPREIEICEMVRAGMTSGEIASALRLAQSTVETHRRRIRKKLGLKRKGANLGTRLRSLD